MPPTRWMTMADPIHGILRYDRHDETHRLLLEVMNSRAFQRLRRIRQMGLAEFVFPGATHNRFVHSLGATHLMMRAIDYFNESESTRKLLASPYDDTGISLERLMLLGILIHDIGHSPLSHTLEDILDLKAQGLLHDDYWNRLILTEDPELTAIWQKYDPQLPTALLNFMGEGEKPKHFLAQLVSSQLDMDRLDYLQRDSHFLGVQYGRIEAERIIVNMETAELPNGQPTLAVREEAIPAVEHYLFGRHQAYKMALHSLDKASEALLKKVMERFRWAREQGIETGHPAPELFQLMVNGKALTTAQYLRMDDYYLWERIHCWAMDSADPLLKTLATRLLQHDILKFVDLCKYGYTGPFEGLTPVYEALKEHYAQRGLSFEFGMEETHIKPKAMYQPPGAREPIWVKVSRRVVDLSEVSTLPLLADPERGQKNLIFVWDREARRFLSDALEQHFQQQATLSTLP